MADHDDNVTDKASVEAAYGALLDGLSDVAVRNARKFVDAGVGRMSIFRVTNTMAEKFLRRPTSAGQPQQVDPVIDTDEKGTKPLEVIFQVDGISPPPTIAPASDTKKGN